jgi:protease I
MAKVVMVIAFNGFRDEEYAEPKEILEKSDHKVTTASTQTGTANGKLGMTTKVDILLDQVNPADYDAVLFIGGPGSYDYFDDQTALNLAKQAVAQDKILGGICAASAILANAGVLKGKKAACFSGVSDILKKNGANYDPSGFAVDGKIITADGPAHAKKFGTAIAKAIT